MGGVDEREAWNCRYAEGAYVPRVDPSPLLGEWLEYIPLGRALDIACGTGRNALYLADAGYSVDAVDISEVAVERARAEAERRNLDIAWHVSDLDEFEIPASGYQLITVIRYRNPALWPRLISGLADDGWLVIEHHLKTPFPVAGPSTPDFRLDPQELLAAFGSLRVMHYSEELEAGDLDAGRYAIARLVACKGSPGY